jgi:hypothetical protein
MPARGKAWTEAENDLLRQHYETLGAAGMHEAGYLAYRPLGSMTKYANRIGLSFVKHAPEVLSPLPRMDLLESLDCVRLKAWRGPVTPGLVGWRLAA